MDVSKSSSREQRPPVPADEINRRAVLSDGTPHITLLLVPFRSGEAVNRHPALQSWIEKGWVVRSAVPRIIEKGTTKLLVVLEKAREPAVSVQRSSSRRAGSSPSVSVQH